MPFPKYIGVVASILLGVSPAFSDDAEVPVEGLFREDLSCATQLDRQILLKKAAVEGFALQVDLFDGGATRVPRSLFVSADGPEETLRQLFEKELQTSVVRSESQDLFGRNVVIFSHPQMIERSGAQIAILTDRLWKVSTSPVARTKSTKMD